MMRLTLRPGALRVRLIMPRFAGLLLLPGVLAAAPVSAQTAPTPISVGETVHGSLSTSDALMVDNSYYDFYLVQTSPGQRLVFTLRSDDFDAYLSAGRGGSAASYEYTDSDDDGAGGTDARLVIDAEGGPYLIRANSLHAASTGSYTLSVTGSAGSNAPGVRSLRAGETVSGRLTASDYLLDDGSYYDLYRYEGMAGDRISVTLRSSDFDTFLAVGTDEGGTELGNASFNDDGADGTNSAVAMTLPSSGSYLIRANSLMGGATGSYTIQLEATRGGEPSAGGSIFLGQVLDGVLTSSDPTLADGSYYKEYRFDARAGDRLVIRLDSDDFDPFLTLGRSPGGTFESVASDDDSGSGVNALLEYDVTTSGTYVIRANSWSGGSTGAFTLSLGRR